MDLASGELRKQGLRIRLQEQPFQVLTALLERPGELVSREDLIRRLWPDGIVVDFDRGLNAAVARLRQALSDSAEVPRYVETVASRGYRFIGALDRAGDEGRPSPPLPRRVSARLWALATLLTLLALGAGWWVLSRSNRSRSEATLKVTPLTSGEGRERNPSFSPDGSQIAYEWDKGDGKPHVYIKLVGPGDPVRLTSSASAEFGPSWSPDGRLIAFLRPLDQSRMGVFVVPPLGGVERKLTESVPPSYWRLVQFHRRLDWTRDSRHLIVSAPEHLEGAEGLFLASIDNGEKTWLTQPSVSDSLYGDREPAVSPDGRMLAFVRGEVGAKETIHILPLSSDLRAAGPPRALAPAGPARSPVWAPGGHELIYTTVNVGFAFGSGVFRIGLKAGDQPRPLLALGRNAAVPAMARTGRLAYSRISFNSTIWRQEIPTRAGAVAPPENLIASSAVDFNAQYSPDGSRIAFASNRSGSREIWTCANDGTHCIQVTAFNGLFLVGSPRWSPNGKQLAFDGGPGVHIGVYVVDSNGGVPRRLTDDSANAILPSWSHDGNWIYVSSARTGKAEIWKIPCAGGTPLQVTRNGGFVAFESPDGRALYYTKTEPVSKLFKSALDGSGETEVLSGVAHRGFAVAPDRVYYLRQDADGPAAIRRFMLATRLDSQVASISQPLFLGLSISPDGRYLIYSQMRNGSNLMLVEDFH